MAKKKPYRKLRKKPTAYEKQRAKQMRELRRIKGKGWMPGGGR